MKVAVFGSGSWGVWTALELQSKGVDVTLYDMFGAGNSYSGSGGLTRIIRMVYGNDRIYSELTSKSFSKWDKLSRLVDEELYTETGVLWMLKGEHSKYLDSSKVILEDMGYSLDEISLDASKERFPSINLTDINRVFFESKAGILNASDACKAALYSFIESGGHFVQGKVHVNGDEVILSNTGERIIADKYVFATGSWTRKIFPDLLEKITYVTRQEVFFYKVNNSSLKDVPVWSIIHSDGMDFYGFPPHNDMGIKIAYDMRQEEMDPDTDSRELTWSIEERSRSFASSRFKGLKAPELQDYRVCHYDNSIDGHFIIDFHPTHPDFLVMTGSSGHGFKMGPAIGELAKSMLLQNVKPVETFSFNRFNENTTKKTQYN